MRVWGAISVSVAAHSAFTAYLIRVNYAWASLASCGKRRMNSTPYSLIETFGVRINRQKCVQARDMCALHACSMMNILITRRAEPFFPTHRSKIHLAWVKTQKPMSFMFENINLETAV